MNNDLSARAAESRGDPASFNEPSRRVVVVWLALFGAGTVSLLFLLCSKGGWAEAGGLPGWGMILVGIGLVVVMLWLCLRIAFRHGAGLAYAARSCAPAIGAGEYEAHGLGPVAADGTAPELYLDLMKRAVANILYQDKPLIFYDDKRKPILARRFDLSRRVMGEDAPTYSHTMIGIRRLENVQFCIESVIRDGVPGDLVEAGVFRGGAAIFMRAVLKAHGIADRCVYACDTFTPIAPAKPHWLVVPFMQGIGSVPSRWWRRKCFHLLQRLLSEQSSFPVCEDPSDDLVDFVMWHLRNPAGILTEGGTSLDEVKSCFARYGLLDDQVVFLQGFFADTLPTAPLKEAAVIRLDGDTYESTRDALTLLYPKLSAGGFCIIDDYNAYPDCKRAVEEYRQARGITDEIQKIDRIAVFWQKS